MVKRQVSSHSGIGNISPVLPHPGMVNSQAGLTTFRHGQHQPDVLTTSRHGKKTGLSQAWATPAGCLNHIQAWATPDRCLNPHPGMVKSQVSPHSGMGNIIPVIPHPGMGLANSTPGFLPHPCMDSSKPCVLSQPVKTSRNSNGQ